MVQAAFGRCGGGPLCSVASRERRQRAAKFTSERIPSRLRALYQMEGRRGGGLPLRLEFRPAASVSGCRNLTPTNRLVVQTISQLRRTVPSFVNSRSNLCGTSAVGHAMARRAPLSDMSQTTHAKHLLGCANETTAARRIGRRWALRWSRC